MTDCMHGKGPWQVKPLRGPGRLGSEDKKGLQCSAQKSAVETQVDRSLLLPRETRALWSLGTGH